MNRKKQFKELHQQTEPLQIGNVWDCQSALMFEKAEYKAIGTSSAAIASSLGYEDGEQIGFEQLSYIVKQITSKVSIPLTVDIEGGYSRDVNEIIKNIVALSENGAVGINIEDSVVDDGRTILNTRDFCKTIERIKSYLEDNNINIFLNVRTDAYIMGLKNPLEETLSRAEMYEKAGADGIFVPCITAEAEIKEVVKSTALPVNVMAMPNLPGFKALQRCGVKRVSMGPFLYNHMNKYLKNILNDFEKDKSFDCLFVTK